MDNKTFYIFSFFLITVFILDIILLLFFLRYKNVSSFYIKLKQNEKVEEYLPSDKSCLIGVLAPWCGHCKKLKESGVLEEVSKEHLVIELDDKHPQAKEILQKANCRGFPCLAIYKNKKINGYEKARTYESILSALR